MEPTASETKAARDNPKAGTGFFMPMVARNSSGHSVPITRSSSTCRGRNSSGTGERRSSNMSAQMQLPRGSFESSLRENCLPAAGWAPDQSGRGLASGQTATAQQLPVLGSSLPSQLQSATVPTQVAGQHIPFVTGHQPVAGAQGQPASFQSGLQQASPFALAPDQVLVAPRNSAAGQHSTSLAPQHSGSSSGSFLQVHGPCGPASAQHAGLLLTRSRSSGGLQLLAAPLPPSGCTASTHLRSSASTSSSGNVQLQQQVRTCLVPSAAGACVQGPVQHPVLSMQGAAVIAGAAVAAGSVHGAAGNLVPSTALTGVVMTDAAGSLCLSTGNAAGIFPAQACMQPGSMTPVGPNSSTNQYIVLGPAPPAAGTVQVLCSQGPGSVSSVQLSMDQLALSHAQLGSAQLQHDQQQDDIQQQINQLRAMQEVLQLKRQHKLQQAQLMQQIASAPVNSSVAPIHQQPLLIAPGSMVDSSGRVLVQVQQGFDYYGYSADTSVSSHTNTAEIALLLQQQQQLQEQLQEQQQVLDVGGVPGTHLGNSQHPQLQQWQQQQQPHLVQLQPRATIALSATGLQMLSRALGRGVSAAAAPVFLSQQSDMAAGGCEVMPAQQQAQQQSVFVPGQQQQQQYLLVQQQQQQPSGTGAV